MTLERLYEELGKILGQDESYNNWNVVVPLSNPSIGSSASSDVEEVRLGFDWDNKTLFLRTKDQVVTCRPITKERLAEKMKTCADVHERHEFFTRKVDKRSIFEIGFKEGFKQGIFARAESIE
jgi:hypothetical protein